MDDTDDLIEAIMAANRTIMRAMSSTSASEWLDLEMTMPQWKALFIVTTEGPLFIGRIAELLGVGLPTASHLVDKLVHAGLVLRAEDPDDRRRMLVRLSQRGEELMGRLYQGRLDQFRAWCARLAPDDLAALAQGVQAMAAVVAQSGIASPNEYEGDDASAAGGA